MADLLTTLSGEQAKVEVDGQVSVLKQGQWVPAPEAIAGEVREKIKRSKEITDIHKE